MSMWTKQTVEEKIKQNPHFKHFLDEDVGTYACVYAIESIQVIIITQLVVVLTCIC